MVVLGEPLHIIPVGFITTRDTILAVGAAHEVALFLGVTFRPSIHVTCLNGGGYRGGKE